MSETTMPENMKASSKPRWPIGTLDYRQETTDGDTMAWVYCKMEAGETPYDNTSKIGQYGWVKIGYWDWHNFNRSVLKARIEMIKGLMLDE